MHEKLLGSTWLQNQYDLHSYSLTHKSYAGTRLKKEIDENGEVTEIYPPHYDPGPSPIDHIEFLLKYDDLNLDFLKAVLLKLNAGEIADQINKKPKGTYERRIGFLYEFLTDQQLAVPDQTKGNYINLLDEKKYVVGKIGKNQRWLINDNLLGTSEFCPIVRKTSALQNVLQEDYKKLVDDIADSFPADIFHRAVNYLYTKETRSSYQIEKEKPTQIGR